MRNPTVPFALLVPLMLVSAASRLSASGEAGPPGETRQRVLASPEKPIVLDGARVVVLDGDGPVVADDDDPIVADDDDSIVADLPDFPDHDLPHVVRFRGHRSGGYLGVRSIEMTPELRQHFGAPRDAGVMVGSVEPESPAAKAGIQVADILTAVDGEEVGSTRALSRSVRRHKDGDTVKVDLLRDRSKKRSASASSGTGRTRSPGRTGSVPGETGIAGTLQRRLRFRRRRHSRRFPLADPAGTASRIG